MDETIILVYGRFQPFTIGHLSMLDNISQLKEMGYNNYYVGTSAVNEHKHKPVLKPASIRNVHTSKNLVEHNDRKNPLTTKQKVKYIKLAMKSIGLDSKRVFVSSSPINAFKKMRARARKIIIISGSDRVPELRQILDTNNNKYFQNFERHDIISVDREGSGISATLVRSLAVENNFEEFKKKVSYLDETRQKKLYNQLRKAYYDMIRSHNSLVGPIENVATNSTSPSTFSISSKSKSKQK